MSTFSCLANAVSKPRVALARAGWSALAGAVRPRWSAGSGAPALADRLGCAGGGRPLDRRHSVVGARRQDQVSWSTRRARRLAAALVCGIGMWLALSSSPALAAAGTFTYQSQLTGFTGAKQVAFDAQGDIYVADSGANAVDEYDPTGTTLLHQQIIGLRRAGTRILRKVRVHFDVRR